MFVCARIGDGVGVVALRLATRVRVAAQLPRRSGTSLATATTSDRCVVGVCSSVRRDVVRWQGVREPTITRHLYERQRHREQLTQLNESLLLASTAAVLQRQRDLRTERDLRVEFGITHVIYVGR
jgi:hypothetical protein